MAHSSRTCVPMGEPSKEAECHWCMVRMWGILPNCYFFFTRCLHHADFTSSERLEVQTMLLLEQSSPLPELLGLQHRSPFLSTVRCVHSQSQAHMARVQPQKAQVEAATTLDSQLRSGTRELPNFWRGHRCCQIQALWKAPEQYKWMCLAFSSRTDLRGRIAES